MSTNQNELIRLLLAQQQQQQQQGSGAPIQNNNYQPQQVYQQLGGAVPPLNTVQPQQQQQQGGGTPAPANNNQLQQLYQQFGAPAPAGNAGQQQQQQQAHSADALSQLIANCLEGAAGPAGSNSAAGVLNQSNGMNLLRAPSASSNTAQPSNSSLQAPAPATSQNSTSLQEQQQQLLQSAKLLANINPELAAATMQQALALIPGTAGPPQVQQLPQHPVASVPSQPEARVTSNGTHNGVSDKPLNMITTQTTSHQTLVNNNKVGVPSSLPIAPLGGRSSISAAQMNPKNPPTEPMVCTQTEPLSLLTLRTWDLEKLESHVQNLEASNKPIPNTLRIALESARSKEEKKQAKRMANRKSASISRARKNQLIDELTASHAKLRRQVLILSYLPDPVAVINSNGEIMFCSAQMERVLKLKVGNLVGSNIDDVIVPESRNAMHQLIEGLIYGTAGKQAITRNGEGTSNSTTSDEADDVDVNNINSSGNSSNDAHVVSRASKQSFPLLEVNVDGENQVAVNKPGPFVGTTSKAKDRKHKMDTNKFSTSAHSLTQKSSSLTSETSPSEDNDEPQLKKAKHCRNEKVSSEESYPRDTLKHDDVMGSSVTANNADAKLSSLIHYPDNKKKQVPDKVNPTSEKKLEPSLHRKRVQVSRSAAKMMEKQEDSRSSSSSDSVLREGANNSSEGSGYRNSNESSDQDSSSISGTSITSKKKVKRHRPLAPACSIRLVRKDLTSIWCELTASVHQGTCDDEDKEQAVAPNKVEKEILLCFRPLCQGDAVGEELRFPMQKNKSVDKKIKVSDPDTDTPSTETGTGNGTGTNSNVLVQHRPMKKRPYMAEDTTMSSEKSMKRSTRYEDSSEMNSNQN